MQIGAAAAKHGRSIEAAAHREITAATMAHTAQTEHGAGR